MKMKTTAWSFRESRSIGLLARPILASLSVIHHSERNSRKQVVKTSSSFAPLQVGNSYPRQNFRLQSLQVRVRCFCFSARSSSSNGSPAAGGVLLSATSNVRSWRFRASLKAPESPSGSRGIIVLLEKQVHLQKEVGSSKAFLVSIGVLVVAS